MSKEEGGVGWRWNKNNDRFEEKFKSDIDFECAVSDNH